ncbi:predicted protein, partial [Arabidopsis lyrata subsp. lyrata]
DEVVNQEGGKILAEFPNYSIELGKLGSDECIRVDLKTPLSENRDTKQEQQMEQHNNQSETHIETTIAIQAVPDLAKDQHFMSIKHNSLLYLESYFHNQLNGPYKQIITLSST